MASTIHAMDPVLALLEREGSRLYAMLFRLTLRYDVTDDLMQELFLRLQSGGVIGSAQKPAAYVRRMAINLAMDWRRAQRRSMPFPLADEPVSRHPSPIQGMVEEETWNSILNALASLSEATREIVVRRFLERESYEAIGQTLGKSAHQTRALCYAGIRQLRQRLAMKDEVSHD